MNVTGDPLSDGASQRRRPLSDAADAIIQTDATAGAIAERLKELALDEAAIRELVDFLNRRAETMTLGESPDAMQELTMRSRLVAEHIGYEEGIAGALLFEANARWIMSDLEQALRNLLDARRRFANLGDEVCVMKARSFEGSVYRSLGDYDQSYLDLTAATDYFRKEGDAFWESISALSLAITCEQIGDYEGMQRNNARILEIEPSVGQRWIVGRALIGLGNTYAYAGDHHKALEYYERGLAVGREAGHQVSVARSLNDMGTAWRRLGNTDNAERYHRESFEIRKEIGQREAQCTCLFNLGELAIDTGDPEQALAHFNEALAIATAVGAKPRISQAHKHLSDAYEVTGDSVAALRHHRLFHEVNEEVVREQSGTRMKNLTIRLELDKAEKLAEIEQEKNAKLSEQNDELNRLLDELQRAQAHLIQSEKMAVLGKLVAGVAHELNTPVGASTSSIDISRRCVTGLLDLIKSAESLDSLRDGGRFQKLMDSLVANCGVVSDANERIRKIVGSLKSFARLDEAKFQTVDIHDGLEATITLLEADDSTDVRIDRRFGTLPKVSCYPGELNQMFLNVLTNSVEAIQRGDGGGKIVVQTSHEGGHVRVEIRDDGAGIPADKFDTLFDPGFSDARGRVKAGMGLFVSHSIVEKHRGTITVNSEVGNGTTVTVTLPVS